MILALLACQRSEGRYLRRTVAAAELGGKWVMTQDAVADLRAVGYSDPVQATSQTIVLRPDLTCHYSALRPSMDGLVPTDAECTWSLLKGRHQSLRVAFANGASTGLSFWESQRGHLLLWQYIDDPDAWRYIEFEREPSEAS